MFVAKIVCPRSYYWSKYPGAPSSMTIQGSTILEWFLRNGLNGRHLSNKPNDSHRGDMPHYVPSALLPMQDHQCWMLAIRATHTWWCHQMETFSALLALCAGNSPVTGEFPSQRPVTWSFDVFFHLCLNKRLNKQWWGWWFEMPSRLLWGHCIMTTNYWLQKLGSHIATRA